MSDVTHDVFHNPQLNRHFVKFQEQSTQLRRDYPLPDFAFESDQSMERAIATLELCFWQDRNNFIAQHTAKQSPVAAVLTGKGSEEQKE